MGVGSVRFGKPCAVLLAGFLVACGGGGGGSGGGSTSGSGSGGGSSSGSGGAGNPDARLEMFESNASGLFAHEPASPGTVTQIDVEQDIANVRAIPVLGASWDNGETRDGYIREVVYQNSSNHLMRVSTDGSGGVTPTPKRVSDNVFEACGLNIGQDFADLSNVRIAFQNCADDEWWWTVLSRDASGKIVPFPGEPLVDLVDPVDGSHDGWLALDQGVIKHMDDQGVTTTVTGSPTGIGDARHLESIQTGNVLLNIDGDLHAFNPGSGLTDLGHSFTYSTCAPGPSTCPVLYTVDDSEMFFIDDDRLYRTDFSTDQVIELEAATSPTAFPMGGRRLAVGTDRVVWTFETDPSPGSPLSGDEETVIRTVDKDTGAGADLDRVPLLDPVISPQNQPFFDRAGDWFFYTWSNGLGTQPTAAAARMDQGDSEAHAGAVWRGLSTNLISFAPLASSLQHAYLVDGMTDSTTFANRNLKAVSADAPGITTLLGTIPSDATGFSTLGGFGGTRLGILTSSGDSGSETDVMYFDAESAGSLQRLTNSDDDDETPAAFF